MPDRDDGLTPKSKTRLKKDMLALQKLGEQLVKLTDQQLGELNLPEDLQQAIHEAKRLTSHEAIRRQFQYIGKIIRKVDTQAIQDYLANISLQTRQAVVELHRLEQWREKLVQNNPENLTEFLIAFPNADRQHLRQLISNARKEQEIGKPKGANRALLRYLRELQQHRTSDHE